MNGGHFNWKKLVILSPKKIYINFSLHFLYVCKTEFFCSNVFCPNSKISINVSRGKGCCKIGQLAGTFAQDTEGTSQGEQLMECNRKILPQLCNFYVTPFVSKYGRTQGWHAEFIDIGFDNGTRCGFIRNCGIS